MAIKLRAKITYKNVQSRQVLNEYKKEFKRILMKDAQEGIETIRAEIKKRDLAENDDVVSVQVKNNKVSYSIDYDKAKGKEEEKVTEKTTLAEALSPQMLEKLVTTHTPEKLQAGFQKGIKKVREKIISDINNLNSKIMSKYV